MNVNKIRKKVFTIFPQYKMWMMWVNEETRFIYIPTDKTDSIAIEKSKRIASFAFFNFIFVKDCTQDSQYWQKNNFVCKKVM